MQLQECLPDYYVTSRCRVKATIDRYGYAVKALELMLGRAASFTDLTPHTLRKFEEFRAAAGRTANTIAGEVAKLKSLARWGCERGHCPPLTYHGVAPIHEPPTAFTLTELQALAAAAHKYRWPIAGIPGNLFLSALLSVLYDTGERLGAVLAIEWAKIDFAANRIHFAGATRKNHRAGITRPVRDETIRQLRALSDWQPHGPFQGPHRGTVYIHWRRLLTEAGLKPDRKLGPHAVRRSHASLLHLAGGDAAASLGHASEATTRRHYYDPRITDQVAACHLLPQLSPRLRKWWWPWWFWS
jgi:integrase